MNRAWCLGGALVCALAATAVARPRAGKSPPEPSVEQRVAQAMAAERLKAQSAQMVADLAALRFDRLGNPVLRWDHLAPVAAPPERPHRLLVVLVEFADRGFDRFADAPDQGARLAAFYQELLFDPDYARPNTLSHFYRSQSLGRYHLQGTVLPPVRLSQPRGAYGAPYRPEGGDWRNDANPEGLVEEALGLAHAAHPELDWAAFDRWDPLDFDGDGQRAEADGYIDHFVLIYAGGGQSSCQGLHKLHERLNPNAGPEVLETLTPVERECAERIWPHRFLIQKRVGQGPLVEGRRHRRGGAPLSAERWVLDYNMQSEYTEPSTFIHEFGHSLGLPDVYARETSNGTGVWDVMSSTADPVAQNLSAWSRLMLGWLEPKIILPPSHGGRAVQSVYLQTLDDPPELPLVEAARAAEGLTRAALVVLPPKTRTLRLTELTPSGGSRALYSGQGNDLNRVAEVRLDLRGHDGAVTLEFDAWWEIEGGWDFAYLESSVDEGGTWQRHVPNDPRHMPAKHGHDGRDTLPGFTGLSGDLDGDGKNESSPGCDPTQKLSHGEDKRAEERNPCLEPSWVRVAFDLSSLAGRDARVRLRYFTDMAAVMRGILIDNLVVTGPADALREDFEAWPLPRGWHLEGFTASGGEHTLLVPHYYLLEYRDPYETKHAAWRYDRALVDAAGYRFFHDLQTKTMRAVRVRPRPGVVAWYVDGAFAWSENEPTSNGPGKGFLLAVDAWPNELPQPGLEPYLRGRADAFNTRFEINTPPAQEAIRHAFTETMCFVRSAPYRPAGLRDKQARPCAGDGSSVETLRVGDKRLMYAFRRINELLPGEARAGWLPASEAYDYRERNGGVEWRLRDRTLRMVHTLDAPFSLTPFEDGVELFDIRDGQLVKTSGAAHPAVRRFTDATPERWLNAFLPFGGVAVPDEGLAFELAEPKPDAPPGARVKVWFEWER